MNRKLHQMNRKKLNKNGVVFIKNLISKGLIDELFATIIELFKKYFPKELKWCKKGNSKIWNSNKFHKSIIICRKKSPKKFGYIYDTLQDSYIAKKLMTHDKILSKIKKLSNLKTSKLICFNSIVRFDLPFDNKNSVDWHYDIYERKNFSPENGYTVQIFFHKTNLENGTPHFLIGSHKHKFLQKTLKQKKNTSYKYLLDTKKMKKFSEKRYEANAGDALLFPLSVIHRSGENTSKKARISGIFRYYPFV